jgi:hypothetical protein
MELAYLVAMVLDPQFLELLLHTLVAVVVLVKTVAVF